MKRLGTAGVGVLMVIGILCLTAAGRAGIPDPDVIYFGMATHKGGIEKATEEITLVLNADSRQVAAYTPGSIPEYEDRYVLRVPIDALTSTEGQAATFYIGGRLAGSTHIPAKGTVGELNLDTLESNDSDNGGQGDGMDDTWEMAYFGTLDRDGTEDINGNGITDLQEYRNGTDPTAAVWLEVDDLHRQTCVFHPLVLHKALMEAASDGQHNLINLQAGTYAGNFSYTAVEWEDYDLEIVGGYGDSCAEKEADAGLTVLDGDTDGDGTGDGPVLRLDTASGQTKGAIRVEGLSIRNGSAPEGGGLAVVTDTGDVVLLNNIIADNTAEQYGGGLSLHVQGDANKIIIANNTINGNSGGGIYYNSSEASPIIMNNIITNNINGQGIRIEGGADPTSDYNNLWDNEAGGYNDPDFQGDHDLAVDPLFVGEQAADFSLTAASACIDAGRNRSWLPDSDIRGRARVMDGDGDNTYRVDMGAYEWDGSTPPASCDFAADEDCDTAEDANDQCPGFDDTLDGDDDGVPDGCDRCPGIDDLADDNDNDGMPDCWEIVNGLDTTEDDANEDLDGDDFSNLREYLAGTSPNDETSVPENQVPTVPKPTQPQNQSEVGTLRPTLAVSNAIDDDLTPPVYDFEVYAIEDMTGPVAAGYEVNEETDSNTTSWQVNADLDDNTVYRWRVRAGDVYADQTIGRSAWSNFSTFFVNTANDAPAAPSLNSPEDGEEVQTSIPALVINNAEDADQDVLTYCFEIYLADPSDANVPALRKSSQLEGTGGTTSWSPSELDDNTRYYWRAGACDQACACAQEGCIAWMPTAVFFVNTTNDQPSIPDISAPPDGSQVTTIQPTLEVTNASDDDEDSLTYEFQLYADEAMTTLITFIAGVPEEWDGTTSWQVGEVLQQNRTYWWRARARDDEDAPSAAWSGPFSFTVSTSNTAPEAPDILTPVVDAVVQTLQPSLVIYNSPDLNMDALTYYFDIDKVNTFNSTALQRSPRLPEGVGGITSWCPPLPLADRTTYYWRVIAYDGASYSDWSTGSFSINLANDPPTAPTILTPENEVQTLQPSLVIYNSTDLNMDAITYYFDIDKVSTFNSTVLQRSPRLPEGVGGMTSWRPSALADNTTYYWRVIAYDGASYSDWTEGSFFINLANDPPSTPAIQSPGQGNEVAALRPVLQLNEAADADMDEITYDYEVYADPDGTNLVSSAQGAGTSWQVDADLDDNTFYWWRVRARDEEGAPSAWSGLFAFFVNTVNDAPTAPSVNSPQDGRVVQTREPALEVNNAADVDGDVLTYEFEIDQVSTFSSNSNQFEAIPQGGANTTSFSPSELVDHTTYYWRARACDEESCSEWIQTARFLVNTSNEAPSIPNISTPPDGSQVTTLQPTLEVTNGTDPDHDPLTYEFELYADQAMKLPVTLKIGVLEEGDGTTSWGVSCKLKKHRTYWWRVQARDSKNEPSGWSDLIAFTVNTKNNAPDAPSIVNPQNGGEVETLETVLEVSNAADEDRDSLTYLFEIDTVNTFDSPTLRQSPAIQEDAGHTTSWSPSELADHTTYYWRARAFDGAAYSDWSTGSFFVNCANDPPRTPTIQNPDEGCVLTVPSPTLSVYPDTDVDLDELTYDYEVYSDPGLNADDRVTFTEGAGAWWQVDVSLEDHLPYYWRARCVDEQGLSSQWASPVSFSVNTQNAQPLAPTLNNPYNGGIVTILRPTLSVNNAVDPDDECLTYEFGLYADRSLTEQVAFATLAEGNLITSWAVDTDLKDKTTYYWRARAYDGKLPSAWMSTAVFVVDTEGADTKVELECAQEVSASAQITQIVKVTKRGSPLKGVSVEIKPGALAEDCTITIGMVTNPAALPANIKAIGKVIEFGPEGVTFAIPVTIRIPYTQADLDNAGVSNPAELEVWAYRSSKLNWEKIPVDSVDTAKMFYICKVDHFSMFTTGKSVTPAQSVSGVGSDGDGGCFIATVAY